MKTKVWLFVALLLGLGGACWWQRDPILSWYYVRQLTEASDGQLETYAQKLAHLGEGATPRLLDGLCETDPAVCAKMQYPLILMAKKWGHADTRTSTLVVHLHTRFGEFSPVGQEKAVLLVTNLMQNEGAKPSPPRLTKVVGEFLTMAEKNIELRAACLLLLAELVDCVQPGQWVDAGRAMTQCGLEDARPECRVSALRVLLREPMRKDRELLEKALPLLRDKTAAVRKHAVLVLAAENEVAHEDSFLKLLHDDDPEVQFLCENALRKRGLSDDDIRIARMLSDREPTTRMRVLQYLRRVPDVNLDSLLRQLSNDPAKAVRAAAIRAAADYPHVDLSKRLTEMAASDPEESIRMNARYYLQERARRAARD
jgi:HEAT repeat protein